MEESEVIIRQAGEDDKYSICEITKHVIKTGDTYILSPNSNSDKILNYWFGQDKIVFVAEINNKVVGVFNIRPNQPDLGNHVANSSYMVSPRFQNRGVGKIMAKYSLQKARELGYKAMQYNFVVKSNIGAIKLWQKLGFSIIGEIPQAFRHSKEGLVNAYIMYRKL